MPLRFRRVTRTGPIPPELEVLHLSRCEHCLMWERSHYQVIGSCRRYPHPKMYYWQKCKYWTNRHGKRSLLDEFMES